MLYYLPTYLPLPPPPPLPIYAECLKCKTQHSSAAVSSACFSSFLAAVSSSGLCFFDMYSLTVGYFMATFIFFCCCPASASASDDLNVLPVLCFVCFLLFCYLRLYLVAASLERTYLMDTFQHAGFELPLLLLAGLFFLALLVFDLARYASSCARFVRLH